MGVNTTNGYFYKPAYGAKGLTEKNAFDAKLDVADAAIKANLDAIATKAASGANADITSLTAFTGGQIAFPATAVPSADANTLDDYEEGSWTTGVSFGGGTTGITYSLQTGFYTKIGNIVNVNGILTLTSKGTDNGDALITGLPFTIVNDNAGYIPVTLYFENVTFANQFQGVTIKNTTTIYLSEITEAGVVTALTDADFADNTSTRINCTYRIE